MNAKTKKDDIDPLLELCISDAKALRELAFKAEALGEEAKKSKPAKKQAQALMKLLKERLKKLTKIEKSQREMKKRGEIEQQFLHMIADAAARIHVRYNSNPTNRNWQDELYD